jgi:hypothetical protein
MTVPDQSNKKQSIGNGSTTDFPIPYSFTDVNDIVVILTDLNGTDLPQTIITDYTIIGVPNTEGTVGVGFESGTLTMNVAPPTGYKVTSVREVTLNQATNYRNVTKFDANSHELALDKVTMIVQDQQELHGRTVTLSPTSVDTAPILEDPVGNGGKVLVINAEGTHIEYQTISPTDVVSNYPMNTFSGDAIETDFILGYTPIIVNSMRVSVDNVQLQPTVDFNVTGTTLSFTVAPAFGVDNIWAIDIGSTTAVNTPADGSVTTVKLATQAVTNDKIAPNAITADKIEDNAITTSEIQDNAVTTDKILDLAVTSDKIEDDAISNIKILNNSVNNPKIEDGAVSFNKLDTPLQNMISSGIVIQQVYAETATGLSFNSEIPYDNTIPQNTEGVEQITVNITPTDTNNILIVEGHFSGAFDLGSTRAILTMSLFQDSIADAIAASSLRVFDGARNLIPPHYLVHRMIVPTATPTVFKMRYGSDVSGTASAIIRRNLSVGGQPRFGALLKTWIKVTEIQV